MEYGRCVEVRGGAREFLHSRFMCWVAFDRGIRLAQKRSLSAPLQDWLNTRDAIREDIFTNFWNEELQSLVQSKGSKDLDASVLLMPLMRFISPVDPLWLSTLRAIESRLVEDTLVHRYEADVVMPEMSGRDLSQILGALRPELKTI